MSDFLEDKNIYPSVVSESSIYETPTIYDTGAGEDGNSGGVNAGKNYIIRSTAYLNITEEFFIQKGPSASDSHKYGVCPLYETDLKWNELNNSDEIEVNAIVNIKAYGSSRTQVFSRCGIFDSQNNDRYKFEINNYDGKSWFYIFGSSRPNQFVFNFNTDLTINFIAKKIDSQTIKFICKYAGNEVYNDNLSLSETVAQESCLPTFGMIGQNGGLIYDSKLYKGSYIRIKDQILFGKKIQ